VPAARTRARSAKLAPEEGCLLIADISGYTGYVVAGPLEYAEDVVADVTATVADQLGAVFRLNKLEGDAVFGYTLGSEEDGSILLDAVESCYFTFRRRLEAMQHATNCTCTACTKLPELDLKFVLHYGTFIRRTAGGREELTGEDVILVHRLLKNAVVEELGTRGYVLVTEACARALSLDPRTLGWVEHRESHSDVGDLCAFVSDLERRWRDERDRTPVYVSPEEAAFQIELTLASPQPRVWDYLTSPEKRFLWQDLRIDEVTDGGRRCTGTVSVCVDGHTMVYEEILDWRPFDYFTERRTLPGVGKLVLTTELESVNGSTRVRTRAQRLQGADRLSAALRLRRVRRDLERAHGRLAAALAEDRGVERAEGAAPGALVPE
jgi:uncharacterized protein YndB with AHSA1/START domain